MIITDINLLRTKCSDVLIDEVSSIREALEKELEHSAKVGNPGVGLAAPQIGIYKRFAIVRFGDYKIDLVNCKIIKAFDEEIFEGEGCLSFPGKTWTTKRFSEIHVGENLVEPYAFIARGFLAVVVAHEIEHTEGILLPDKAIK